MQPAPVGVDRHLAVDRGATAAAAALAPRHLGVRLSSAACRPVARTPGRRGTLLGLRAAYWLGLLFVLLGLGCDEAAGRVGGLGCHGYLASSYPRGIPHLERFPRSVAIHPSIWETLPNPQMEMPRSGRSRRYLCVEWVNESGDMVPSLGSRRPSQ